MLFDIKTIEIKLLNLTNKIQMRESKIRKSSIVKLMELFYIKFKEFFEREEYLLVDVFIFISIKVKSNFFSIQSF